MSQQFRTNLSVGVLVRRPVCAECMCLREGEKGESEHDVPRHSFPGTCPTVGDCSQLCTLGTPPLPPPLSLLSVWILIWSTPVTSLYPPPQNTYCHRYPSSAPDFLSYHTSSLSFLPLSSKPFFTVFSSLLMASTPRLPTTSSPRSLSLSPCISSLATFHLSFGSLE